MLKICIIVGARPNFFKVAPLVWAVRKEAASGVPVTCQIVYTGKAGDGDIEASLLADLELSNGEVDWLGVDAKRINELTGRVMEAFDQWLDTHEVDVVIVVDDLASTMATAIVAKKRGLRLAHLVAGTRSFDITMPKEINRLVIDGLSDLLFTAGEGGSTVVSKGGGDLSKVYMAGNILMDTLRHFQNRLRRPALMDSAQLADGAYILFTLNRKALTEDDQRLAPMLDQLVEISQKVPVVAVLRNEAQSAVSRLLPGDHAKFLITGPLPYLEFGYMSAHAKGVVTDSGNVAEEATFNRVPCITLNSYTEHIETVKVGTNVLAGEDAGVLRKALNNMVDGKWKDGRLPDRWDGRTAERIVKILLEE